MRHRERVIDVLSNKIVSTISGKDFNGGSNPATYCTVNNTFRDYGANHAYTSTAEFIDDDGGKYAGDIPKPVRHTQISCSPGGMPSPYVNYSVQCGLVSENFSGAVPLHWTQVWESMPSFDGDLAGPARAAFDKFVQQVDESFSLPNDLLEFKEVIDLVPQMFKLANGAGQALVALTQLQGGLSRKMRSIGDLISVLRDADLLRRFGIETLLQDIDRAFHVITEARRRIAYLKKYNGRERKSNFYRKLDGTSKVLSGDIYSSHFSMTNRRGISPDVFPYTHMQVAITPRWCVAEFRAHALVRTEIDGLDKTDALLRTVLGMLGFYNPVKVAWNAIPYSFVLDYFTHIGTFLSSMSAQPFSGKTRVYNAHYSLKIDTTYEYGVLFFNTDYYYVGNCRSSQYIRRLGLPMSGLDITLPSANQQLVMLELIDQKVRK